MPGGRWRRENAGNQFRAVRGACLPSVLQQVYGFPASLPPFPSDCWSQALPEEASAGSHISHCHPPPPGHRLWLQAPSRDPQAALCLCSPYEGQAVALREGQPKTRSCQLPSQLQWPQRQGEALGLLCWVGVSTWHLCSPLKLRTAFPRIPFPVEFKLARFAKWSSEFGVRPSTQRCPVGPACPQSPPVPCPACLPDCRPCQLSAVSRPPPHTSIEQPPPRPLSMAPLLQFPHRLGPAYHTRPESRRCPGNERHSGNTAPPREAVGCRGQNTGGQIPAPGPTTCKSSASLPPSWPRPMEVQIPHPENLDNSSSLQGGHDSLRSCHKPLAVEGSP